MGSLMLLVGLLATTLCCYLVSLAIYRLYFHPLSQFPGPKITALTGWYAFYHDVILKGQYYHKIREMHQKYGPIVRYLPDELHVQDLDFYDEIYASSNRKRDKTPSAMWHYSDRAPAAFTIPHDLHRKRRGVLQPFFSKKAVNELDDVIRGKINELVSRLEKAESSDILRLDAAMTALTTDIITQYAFAKSWDCLGESDFNLVWKETLDNAFIATTLNIHFPSVIRNVSNAPAWLMTTIHPALGYFLSWKADIRKHVKSIMEPSTPPSDRKTDNITKRTIFHDIRDSDLSASEKSIDRLTEEGIVMVGAGALTTSRSLAMTSYHLLINPSILSELRNELKTLWPRPSAPAPPLSTLEQHAPYLTAAIYEGIRLSGSVCQPAGRIAPTETLTFRHWKIPPGTPMAETLCMLLYDPTIFANPTEFQPERWLVNPTGKPQHDERSKLLFARGARNCLGMNLAHAELYLTVAELFRRFELELFETEKEDMEIAHWATVGLPRLGSNGLRIRVKGAVGD